MPMTKRLGIRCDPSRKFQIVTATFSESPSSDLVEKVSRDGGESRPWLRPPKPFHHV